MPVEIGRCDNGESLARRRRCLRPLKHFGTTWPKPIPLKEGVFDDQFGSRALGAGCCRRCQRHRGAHVVAGAARRRPIGGYETISSGKARGMTATMRAQSGAGSRVDCGRGDRPGGL